MNGLLPEESLSDDLFGDFFNFPLQDIDDDDTTNGEEGDWDAKFQNLEPPMDVFTCFPSEFTSSCGINELGRVGTVPGVKQGAALTGINSTVHKSSSPHDIEISKVFQSLSPLSVLESSDSSFSPHNSRPQRMTSPVKGLRSKRKRPPTPRCKNLNPFEPGKPEKSTPGGESGLKTYYAFGQHGKNKRKVLQSKVARKCTHCETTETPQWREGPNGPKTLCNACGVRFKSGRLVPEYRPASSPTFIPSVHSNSHRKIIEMRRKEGGQFHTSMTHGVISRA